jgi:hypothetical protein
MNPKKWYEVYPQGTKQGDEEARVFKALARTQFEWRSTAAIIKESGLPEARVEEILHKYSTKYNPPLIYASKSKDNHWGYWEVCGETGKKPKALAQQDKDARIDKHLGKATP